MRYLLAYLLSSIIGLFLISTISSAEDKLSGKFLFAGLNINGNIYQADIQGIPGYTSCCEGFGATFGLGYGLRFGAGTLVTNDFFGAKMNASLAIAYQDISAEFTETDPFANFIEGNEFFTATSEHRINPSIGLLSIEPSAIVYPFDELPLGFIIGVGLSLPLSKSFVQDEELINPSDAVWSETGTKIRGLKSGDINTFSDLLYSLHFGGDYEFYSNNNLALNADLIAVYYVNPLIQEGEWNATSIRAGFTAKLNLLKPELLPPLPAPLPELPLPTEPPKVFALKMSPEIKVNDLLVSDGATVNYKINREIRYKSESYIPFLIFKKNSDEVINLDRHNNKDLFSALSHSIKAFNSELTLYKLNDENESVYNNRIKFIRQAFIDTNLKINTIEVDTKQLKYPELADEYRRIEFGDTQNSRLININTDSTIINRKFDVDLFVDPNIVAEAGLDKMEGSININDSSIEFNLARNEFELSKYVTLANQLPVSIELNAKDKQGKLLARTIKFYLEPEFINIASFENQNNSGNVAYSEYTIAFFDFDNIEPSQIATNADNAIKLAIEQGKIIELIAMTDNLGSNAHNTNLANSRAQRILSIYNIPAGQFRIVNTAGGIYDNRSPLGRIYNRSVIVRIY